MKPTASFLSFRFFLLLAAFAAAISAEVVLDSDGDTMRNGGKYYLLPIPPIGAGGIIAAAIRHPDSDSCSLAVVSALDYHGWAVTISTLFKVPFISTTFPLNIAFAYLAPNICTNSPGWVVIKSPRLGEPVMLAGAQEPGDVNVTGSFYIKTHDSEKHYYKLVFREQGKDQYGDIGVKVDSAGRRRLVVTDEDPQVFKFDKADGSFTSDLSMVV